MFVLHLQRAYNPRASILTAHLKQWLNMSINQIKYLQNVLEEKKHYLTFDSFREQVSLKSDLSVW